MTTTALITGASAGIGQQLAREFARHGHDLILVARRYEPMQELADELTGKYDVGVRIEAMDLAGANAADVLFDAVAETPVDILVNNAGVLTGGSFARMDEAAIENMLTLNVRALTHLTRRFAAPMIERGHGRILNVASIAAFQPAPKLAVYAATKAYVLSLSEALSIELEKKGVTVTAVCPGYTDTDMLRGGVANAGGGVKIPEFTVLTPERVAADAYAACMDGDVIKVPGIGYAAAMATTRLLPRWAVRRLLKMSG